VVAAAVFALAYDGGSYSLATRSSLAIVVWWGIALGVALGLLPRARISPVALLVGGLLAALTLWTALSTLWADDRQTAVEDVTRPVLYLGVFVLVVLLAPRRDAVGWADGLAIGIAGIAGLALASRLFPHLISTQDQYRFLPFGRTRLTYPIGYWNGLAMFCAMALPFLLRAATAARSLAARGAAVGTLPVVAGVVYLTSSRGGVAAVAVAALAFVALSPQRVAALAALAAGAAGAAGAFLVLHARDDLVNRPATHAAVTQGRTAAGLIVLVCLGSAGAYALLDRFVLEGRHPRPVWERLALAGTVVAVAAAVAVSHPLQRFESFKQLPPAALTADPDYVRSHLTAASGNGRWQYWTAAVDQFRTAPLHGEGAGSFTDWWVQHRPLATFVVDAHSLYVEVLGELGAVGLALVLALVGVGVYLAVRPPRAGGRRTVTAAAFGAAFIAYAFAAGIDWMWELPAVTVVGIVALAMLASSRPLPSEPAPVPARRAVRGGVAAVAVAAIVVAAVPLIASQRLVASESAAQRGDAGAALDAANDARRIEPFASAPYLQLGLVREQLGDLDRARSLLGKAIDRDPRNWQLWVVKARLETKDGRIDAARASLRRVRELNPFPLIYGLTP